MQISTRIDEDTYVTYEVPLAPEDTLVWRLFYPVPWFATAMLYLIAALFALPVILIGLIKVLFEHLARSSPSSTSSRAAQ
jgi:hypothetical protein